uniref:Uncharacterized protein n=1 Tax=CrAss-like virus sp. ctXt06 TaxID=2825837 RepID=A0A8S5V6T1_9CAUD|nr:MAG TPA: hypothetical protein [CrAss-like virus sp. ctXt06]
MPLVGNAHNLVYLTSERLLYMIRLIILLELISRLQKKLKY